MYFSRIRRPVELALSQKYLKLSVGNIGEEHKFIWQLFPHDKDADRDFLYRRFDTDAFQQFFVLSSRKPLENLPTWEIDAKLYEPKIKVGNHYHFNLRVNPVVTKMPMGTDSKKRKRDDVYMDALAKNKAAPETERVSKAEILQNSAMQWLLERAESNGFSVSRDTVLVEGYQRFEMNSRKDKQRIQIGVIDYSGSLTVSNVGLFYRTLNQGLGKSRAFGCGLLMIKKV
ncbi:MAG: type I-E CRISPR-associated protein Cas6/Cse3/CasE [Bacteroidia bacterium]|nr:type I-E CRISPR-associated protein Cas6/Cse3/CasE [Bacteroidia bacterium]NCC88762.1 type I-E CRISPR-associated protein Cas6/Cse3/CasE [Spirochaetia bacterium]